MTGLSLTALSPLPGAEGDLKHYIRSCAHWVSPLPLIIPLHSFKESFPRDRIDPEKLKALPALRLGAPVMDKENTILSLDGPIASSPLDYSRRIHDKDLPPLLLDSPFSWPGLLVNIAGLTPGSAESREIPAPRTFDFTRWQIGLYRILYNEKRQWWEDLRISCQWKIRKPRM